MRRNWQEFTNMYLADLLQKKIMMKNSKLKVSEYMQNISRSKSFGKFVLIVIFFKSAHLIRSNIMVKSGQVITTSHVKKVLVLTSLVGEIHVVCMALYCTGRKKNVN